MLDFLQSFFSLLSFGSGIEDRTPEVGRFVHGNELSLKPSLSLLEPKKRVGFESIPLLQRDVQKKGCSEVKIMMRKEAAARLLSKCKDGGILELKDVAQHLKRAPGNAVRVLSCNLKEE